MKKFKKIFAVACATTMAFSVMPLCAAQDASTLADGTAYLNINNVDWGEFDAEWTNAEITGDGSYTVSMEAKETQSLAPFNALEVVNGETVLGTGAVITVDSISINGEDVELQGPSYTCSADGAGVTTRVNLYNEWNAPDATAVAGEDGHLDNRIADGDLESATACLIPSDLIASVDSIEVNFTVSGFGTEAVAAEGTATEETAAATTAFDASGSYNAYLGIQTPNWTYRDAWNSANGIGSDSWGQFMVNNDSGEQYGVVTDAVVEGNGTYTVSVTDFGTVFADDFAAAGQDYFNLLYISTDIPKTDDVKVTDVTLKVDGKTIQTYADAYLDEDDAEYVKILIQNVWNEDVATIAYYNAPAESVEMSFTISGFDYDAEQEAVVEEATTAETPVETTVEAAASTEKEASSSSNTTVVVVVVICVVVVAAIVVAVVLGKKKNK